MKFACETARLVKVSLLCKSKSGISRTSCNMATAQRHAMCWCRPIRVIHIHVNDLPCVMGVHTTEHPSKMMLKLWEAHDHPGFVAAKQAWGSPLHVPPPYPLDNKSRDEHIEQARTAKFTQRADEVLNEIARLETVIASMQLSQPEKKALYNDIQSIYQSNFGFIHKAEGIELFKQLAARPKWPFLTPQHGFDVHKNVDVDAEFDLDDDDTHVKLHVMGRAELIMLRGTSLCHGIVKGVQRLYAESGMSDCDRKKDHAKACCLMLLAKAKGYQAAHGYVLPVLCKLVFLVFESL